ncbi:xenotropic and polytropic retrovirus receptor 1, partial [Chanos chanos]|uniref:Xenotropic and polytropic retrovirus receptor 1 n=1 Tax=Chanos chanos TaxID=29144 RepID=A0A6J2WTT8_CHACN
FTILMTHLQFSDHLAAHMIPEWKKQYISYEYNPMLYPISTESNGSQKHQKSLHEEFFKACDKELRKVNCFYSEKLSEAQKKLASFGIIAPGVSEAEVDEWGNGVQHPWMLLTCRRGPADPRQLKAAVSELYLNLSFLQRYQELNYTSFCRILKKYESMFELGQGLKWKNEKLDTSPLNREKGQCHQLMSKLEIFMVQLEGGDEQKAQRRLEVPPADSVQALPVWTTFRIGLMSGILISSLVFIVFSVNDVLDWEDLWPLLKLYRGSFLLIEFLLLMGVDMYYWRKSGVNHVLIFELDPRDHLLYHNVLEVAGGLAVCWCFSVLACLHRPLLSIPPQLHPLFFHCLLLLLLLNPAVTCYYKARHWLLALMCKVLLPPFQPVGFSDCWLADQLNSLSPLFLGIWDLLCFYSCELDWRDFNSVRSPPVESLGCKPYSKAVTCLLQCFAPWLRFAQCLRLFWDSGQSIHLLNAGKYSSVFLMVTFAGLYNKAREQPGPGLEVEVYMYLWAVATCVSVLVTVYWDIRMDWGLLRGNGLLKEELVYSRQVYYYSAMLADVFLRISWAINILLAQMKDSASAVTVSGVLSPLEVLRRCIWNLFRLENEHLKNCALSRAVRDFDLSASQESTRGHSLLEKLMDREELDKKEHSKRMLKDMTSCLPLKCLR